MSRTSRSTRTMATGLVLSIVGAATSFITAPYLLDWLGSGRFGAFRAALGWLGFIGLFEFGVGGALQALFARALGTGDRAGMVAAFRIGVKAYLLLAGLSMVAAAALSVVLPELIRLPTTLDREFWIGCGIYLLTFAFLPLHPFRPLAEAAQRGSLVNLLLAAQALGVAAAGISFAYAGWGMVGQFAALAIGGMIFHVGLAWDGLRRYPELIPRAHTNSGLGKSLWALSWPTLLFNLSGRFGLMSDELVVAGLLGPSAVTSFYLTQRVLVIVGSQMAAIGNASWAGLIDLHFRGEDAAFVHRFTQLTRLAATLGAGLLLPVAAWNRELIVLWVGPGEYAGGTVTWLAAANIWVLGLVSLWLWPLTASGLARSTLAAVVCSAAVNFGVSLVATALIGLPGPLLGTTTALVGVTWWWALLLLWRLLGVPPRSLLAAAAGPGALAGCYGAGLVALAVLVPAFHPDWPRWARLLALAGWLMTSAIGYFSLAWLLVFPAADRAEWVARFRGRRGRPAGSP